MKLSSRAIATLILYFIFSSSCSVLAQEKSAPRRTVDFESETEDPDQLYQDLSQPIPPHLVEDRDEPETGERSALPPTGKESDSKEKGKGQAPAKSPSGSNFAFPKTQAELAALLADDQAKGETKDGEKGEGVKAEAVEEANTGKASSGTFLNVKDAEIATLVKTFSKITKRNFVVDGDVKGKITIHLPSPVSEEEALRIFDSVLLLKGFTTVPIGDNTWKVIGAKDAKTTTIPLLSEPEKNASDTLVTQLLRMKYVPAEEMQKALSQFISKDGVINAFTGTNSIILIDSSANINRLIKLVKELDVPALDQDITIVPIKYAQADDIAEKINKILGEENDQNQGGGSGSASRTIPAPSAPTVPGATKGKPGAAAAASSTTTVGKRALPLKIIPDERTNSIIIVADKETTERVQALAEQLDSKLDLSGGRFHVYKLRHAKADEVSQVLNALVSGGNTTYTPTSKTKGSSMSRSRDPSRRFGSGGQDQNQRNQQQYTPPQPQQQISQPTTSGQRSGSGNKPGALGVQTGRVTFEGDISIAADPATNSLIINASRGDYQRIIDVLKVLDSKRRQVLVEATILEVALTKEEGMGIELQGTVANEQGGVVGQTNWGSMGTLFTDPGKLSDLSIAAVSAGSLTLGNLTIPSQAILVSALSRLANVNVLSAPNILTTDNEEAEIIVGENVPFVVGTSQNNTNLNNTFQQIDRQDVGITLRITPQVSTTDFVTLSIFVEISNVVAATRNDPNGPTTTIRTTETVVEVKNNQMIVTGGLIADAVVESTRGVPFISDVPVIGQYFQRQDENVRRTNLLVFITPKILADQFEARDATIEARNELGRVIDRNEVEPNRYEVLTRPEMDNVFESEATDEQRPTTITPPPAHLGSEKSPAEQESGAGDVELYLDPQPVSEDNAPRNLQSSSNRSAEGTKKIPNVSQGEKVSDKTKELTTQELGSDPSAPEIVLDIDGENSSRYSQNLAPAARLSTNGISSVDNSSGTTYVVLQALGDSSDKVVGLAVIGSPDSTTGKHFQVGNQYLSSTDAAKSKKNKKAAVPYVCLGKFSSITEAAQGFPRLADNKSWTYLSVTDSLKLGKNNWQVFGN